MWFSRNSHSRHIVIYLALAILPSRGYGPPQAPEILSASTQRWVGMPDSDYVEHPRIPRRIFQPSHSKPPRRRYRKWPQDSLSVEPRAFEVDTLPSTPQLNAIMDRAMGKVKSMVNELEDEKGKWGETHLKCGLKWVNTEWKQVALDRKELQSIP